MDFDSAELVCNDNGGHLASYTSVLEVGRRVHCSRARSAMRCR
jgi:hypothetical protein